MSDLEQYKETYRERIIQMAQEQEDALFLQQIYTIMIRRKRKQEVKRKCPITENRGCQKIQ